MCRKEESSISASKAKRLAQLVICAGGICFCYLSYGILQERLYADTASNDPAFILFTQCITNILVAIIWNGSLPQRKLPHRLLQATALCYITAMLCSNEAIVYVSYPVLVLAKSCKLIPTMLVGQLVQGRRLYGTSEWLAAGGICCGIVLFQLSKLTNTSEGPSDSRGLVLLGISLTMDGVLSACQNQFKECENPPTAAETMLWLNTYASLLLVPYCLGKGYVKGTLTNALSIPSSQWVVSISILNLTVAIGQIFIFLTIHWFNSVTTTVITTTRKFLTILVSVMYYGHHFTQYQWVAVVMVFCGLYSCIYQTVAKQENVKKQKST